MTNDPAPRRPAVTPELIRRIEDELDLADATPFDVASKSPRLSDETGPTGINASKTGITK